MGDLAAARTAVPPVKSAMRTLDIIEFVVARDRPCVAQEIAQALDIPISSLSYLLATLVERGYLARAGRSYTAGPGLERLQSRSSAFSLAERVAPVVRTLRVQLNETSSFFVREGWRTRALVTEPSEHALRYAVTAGADGPLHGFSAGKALLAELPDAELARYFAETVREPFTAHTIVEEAALRHELAEIRASGVARTRQEYSLGIEGLGRAVRIDGEVVGALSVAIPTVRFDKGTERRVRELLARATDLLQSG